MKPLPPKGFQGGNYKIVRKPNAPALPRGKFNPQPQPLQGWKKTIRIGKENYVIIKKGGKTKLMKLPSIPTRSPDRFIPHSLKDREKMPTKKIISDQTFKLASQHHKKTTAKAQADALKKQGYKVRVYRDPTASSFNWVLYRRKKKYFGRR